MPLSPHRVLLAVTLVVTALSGTAPAATATPDPTPGDHVVWADTPPPLPARRTTVARPADRVGDVLALHSLPGSQHTIFLDFDGHVVSGTVWNEQGVAAARSPGWDPSGNGVATLSAAEQSSITEIWTRVAEDFAPFDVDVTTADPGAAAITRDGLADPTYGVRVLVTADPAARSAINTCAGTCGGAAADDVFDLAVDHATYQPAWVFPQAVGNDPKYVAEVVSHEIGHTFGLSHDDRGGDGQAGYYAGHAGWAPIMGNAYLAGVSQWSNGAYDGSLNTQDDVALIAAGGAPLRPDEGLVLPPPGQLSYLTSAADVDVYQLPGCAGPVRVDADVTAVGADLDVELRLLDLADVLQGLADPLSSVTGRTATGLDASLRVTAPATPTDYLLVVDGTGRDGTTPTTGYDDYGSIGPYLLSVTGCGIAAGSPGPPGVPGVTFSATTATVSWTAPADTGASAVTAYRVLVDGVLRTTTTGRTASIPGLTRGRSYQFSVAAVNAQGPGIVSTRTATVPITRPGAPRIRGVSPGASGGPVSAGVTWNPPTSDGGSALTQYRLTCYRLDKRGRVVDVSTSGALSASYHGAEIRVARAGSYRFAVSARNAAGWGPLSARSARVTAR